LACFGEVELCFGGFAVDEFFFGVSFAGEGVSPFDADVF